MTAMLQAPSLSHAIASNTAKYPMINATNMFTIKQIQLINAEDAIVAPRYFLSSAHVLNVELRVRLTHLIACSFDVGSMVGNFFNL